MSHDQDCLCEAWAAAEAALPEGWEMILRSNFTEPHVYVAIGAELPTAESRLRGNAYIQSASGPTAAAALQTLTERLKEGPR